MAGAGWTTNETSALLSIWGEEKVQKSLTGCQRNRTVYQAITTRMAELGWERTWQQCRMKVKKTSWDSIGR